MNTIDAPTRNNPINEHSADASDIDGRFREVLSSWAAHQRLHDDHASVADLAASRWALDEVRFAAR